MWKCLETPAEAEVRAGFSRVLDSETDSLSPWRKDPVPQETPAIKLRKSIGGWTIQSKIPKKKAT